MQALLKVIAANSATESVQPTSVTSAVDRISERLLEWWQWLPLLGIAVVVVLLFWWLSRWVAKRRWLSKVSRNPFVANLASQGVKLLVMVVGLFLALELLNATTLLATLMGAAGVAGIALGFGLKDTVENYIASVLLSMRQPFAPHDHVIIGEHEGLVARLTPRATILITRDGNHVRLPNASVFKSAITNFTRNSERRFSFQVGIDVDDNIASVQREAIATLKSMTGVLQEPPPQALVDQLGDFNVIITISGWVDQRQFDFHKVRSEAIRVIKERFDDVGFTMPEPIYNVNLRSAPQALPTEGMGQNSATQADADRQAAESPVTELEQARQSRSAVSPPAAQLPEQGDVSPDRHLAQQVDEDRSQAEAEDLLSRQAPLE